MRTVPLLLLAAACAAHDLQPYTTCRTDVEDDGTAALPPMAPELLVPNVDVGVAWYRDVAGFDVRYDAAETESCFAVLELEGGQVLLSHRDGHFDRPNDAIELRYVVSDVDAVYARVTANEDVELVRDIADADYGLRDFVVRDVYGFRVRFASPL